MNDLRWTQGRPDDAGGNADRTDPAHQSPPSPSPQTFPTGPYAGRSLDEIALIDPDYLIDLVREEIGDAVLRAEAARALAARDRLAPAMIVRTLALAAIRRVLRPGPGFRPWAAVLGLGAAAVLGLAFLSRAPDAVAVIATLPSRAAAVFTGRADLAPSPAEPDPVSARTEGGAGVGSGADDAMDPGRSSDSTRGSSGSDPGASESSRASSSALTRDTESGGRPASDAETVTTSAAGGSPAPCGARVPGAIPAESVEDFVDTHQAVEFEVVGTKDTGRVTFLNSQIPYQNHFYVAIFPDDYASFPEPPALFFRGACIVIRGTIERYRGTPQIVLRDPDDVRIVPEP